MEEEERKTRISPMMAGDIIIAQPIREDFQDRFENLLDALDRVRVAQNEMQYAMTSGGEPDKALMKKWYLATWEHQLMCIAFWRSVREHYDEWWSDLRMRNGYVLVKLRPQKIRPEGPMMVRLF